ncbi:hypothetical protein NDAWWUGD_CDS0106 [Salmonella phage SeKF_80]
MTVKHTLIPSRGDSTNHIVRGGDRLEIRVGSSVAGVILVESDGSGLNLKLFDHTGHQVRNHRLLSASVTVKHIRDNIFWGFLYGKSIYKEEKLCPNGAKAIPEKDDDDVPGKYIIWCPTSNLPPRVVLESEKQARAVAHSMAERHGGEFFWCRLHGKVARKAVTTYENVVTRL